MKFKVAYIDDIVLNCQAVKHFFNNDEFEVDTFTSPNEFLDSVESKKFDCVITDVHMPEMSGFDLFEKLSRHPAFNQCPVFFMSTDDSDMNKIRSFDIGGVDFLNRLTPQKEMISRVKNKIMYRRKFGNQLEMGNARLDLNQCRLFIDNSEVNITLVELKILALLFKNYPDVTSKDDFTKSIWGDDSIKDGTVYTHVKNVKEKTLNWDYEIATAKFKGMSIRKRGSVLSDETSDE